ncbi:putative 50S ribosomal protein L18Ae/60S ribosomal protein L20 and L18a [Helianthus annuus]|uniref:50S ribosomal protein L18Ae/60S ribosomal protein L20 and L18a n=1 Tax=Helianthus annuus TaxID=4232 RepID=A0A251V3G6_HELAN|nr:putative 50S ribosomal protein L18Ae/60S ribosomal protein L20 and L18a [Helianthus annuus]
MFPFLIMLNDAGHTTNNKDHDKDIYALINDSDDDFQQGIFDKPLPCFGCGVGWFSFLIGFAFPLMWYYATFLYFGNCYQRDPRERAGLAASAIAVSPLSISSVSEISSFKQITNFNMTERASDALSNIYTKHNVISIAGNGIFTCAVDHSSNSCILGAHFDPL